jgi:small subunit ribosomal protein S14
MKHLLLKDFKRRLFVRFFQHHRISYKSLQSNLLLPSSFRFFASTQLLSKYSPSKLRNRCVLTGRSRGISNYFKISRIMLRHLSSQGLLPGLKKSS